MNIDGIGGLLVDLDGTVYQNGRLVDGALEAFDALARRGVPYRFVTNTTSKPASAIVADLERMGLAIDPATLFTAPRAARAELLDRGWTRCHMVVRDALLEDFEGIEPVASAADAVVLGDVGDGFTYERLNAAFRLLLDGAALVTMARNRYYLGPGGLLLDVGPFAAALEHATGREAILVGKPSPRFFARAFESLGLPPTACAVVGDDLEGDVGGGQGVGARGILVRTGKFREEALARSSIRPDAVIGSVGELVAGCW
jgi:HAD superfamily hydrolase (TIGR01458 family)